MTIQRCVGIDIHSRRQQICYIQHDGCGVCTKILERTVGSQELVAFFEKHIPKGTKVIVEATTNAFRVHDILTAAGYIVIVAESSTLVNLNRGDHIDDKIDAFGLARCLATNSYHPVFVPDQKVRARRNILNLYRRADKDVTRISNELWNLCNQYTDDQPPTVANQKVPYYEHLAKSDRLPTESRPFVEHLAKSLQGTLDDKEFYKTTMKKATLDDPDLLALTSITGISFTVAYALMSRIGTIDRFEAPEKLVAYIGVNPVLCESGEGESPRRQSHYGHDYTKQLLTEAARVVLSNSDCELARWGRKLLNKGKHFNKVVGAVSRRMVHVVWHVLKKHPTPSREGEAGFRAKLKMTILPAFTKEELKAREEFKDAKRTTFTAFADALADKFYKDAPEWTPEQKKAREARAQARRLERQARIAAKARTAKAKSAAKKVSNEEGASDSAAKSASSLK